MESSHLSTDLQTLLSDLLLTSATLLAVIMSAHSRAAGHLQTDRHKEEALLCAQHPSLFLLHKHTCMFLLEIQEKSRSKT